MRCAQSLLIATATIALVGCGGDKKSAPPVPTAQRFVTAQDAPGSKPDPDETRAVTAKFDEFMAGLRDRSINPDKKEMARVFRSAEFRSAGADTRYFGKTHTPGVSTHVASAFIELRSEEAATKALDWLEADNSKPCPKTCAIRINTFDVDDLGDARGVHRIATAKDIREGGSPDETPVDSYWVGFTAGTVTYAVELFGRPGNVSKEQALDIARAYYDRVTGG